MPFGDLRTDLYAMTPSADRTSVLSVYDHIVHDPELRGQFVRNFQTFLQSIGLYHGDIDGVWGPYTEAALLSWQPEMAGRCTRLDDILALPRGVPEEFPSLPTLETAELIAAGIDRDLWLSGSCGGVVHETTALKKDAGYPSSGNRAWVSWVATTVLMAGALGVGYWLGKRKR